VHRKQKTPFARHSLNVSEGGEESFVVGYAAASVDSVAGSPVVSSTGVGIVVSSVPSVVVTGSIVF
jgi:hypothetical protein